jgi:nicotinamidase-related amidase
MEKDKLGRIKVEDTALIVIDMQEKFVPHINKINETIESCVRMVRGCIELGVPIVLTEQYPEGLGCTVPELQNVLGDIVPFEKTAFSLFQDEDIRAAIEKLGRPNLLLTGIESHVCLIQTALDGLAEGYNVHWISDAISSRHISNWKTATKRAIQCGAFSSSAEMSLFQLLVDAKHPKFRTVSKIVK